jgi:K(+)-stimulated pyrophosphate-energized sodium pump
MSGVMQGTQLPDYGRCVDIVTRQALREKILPALVPVLTPVLVGFILGPEALGATLDKAIGIRRPLSECGITPRRTGR